MNCIRKALLDKLDYPLRPITSSVNVNNYKLSEHLTEIIKTNRSFQSFSLICDSFEFLKRTCTLGDNNTYTMISFDVDNLYTSLLVNEAIGIILGALYERENSLPVSFNHIRLKYFQKYQSGILHSDSKIRSTYKLTE